MQDSTVMRAFSGQQLDKMNAEEQARKEAQERQNAPIISGLAGYVRSCWEPARTAKMPIEHRMIKAKRQRNGEYEPEKLNEITRAGGSAV